MGRVFLRGSTFWVEFYHNGKQLRESSRSKVKAVAKKLLQQREGEVATEKVPGYYFAKTGFDDLADDLQREYELNRRKSIDRLKISIDHLSGLFGGCKASQIDTPKIRKYIEGRLADGAAPASVNRELAALKRMLNLGARSTPPKIDRVPYVPMLEERNIRQGFFETAEFQKLLNHLPGYLVGPAIFAFRTGWRKAEILGLKWSQVDRAGGYARLEAGTTKSGSGRTVMLDGVLREVIERQWAARKQAETLSPYVFAGRDGKSKIGNIKFAWDKACKHAGLKGKLFHDMRRTCVRNLTRSGIPERIAMQITGHKTASVFRRYDIVNDADLKLAAEKQEAYLAGNGGSTSTKTRTIVEFPERQELAQ